jgi:hypothetical protein
MVLYEMYRESKGTRPFNLKKKEAKQNEKCSKQISDVGDFAVI